jgi:sulfoxide reductase heme-binding subunit YedZ
MPGILSSKWTKAVLFPLCLVPLGYLLWLGWLEYRAFTFGTGQTGNLTADPIKYITHFTGDWTLRFLLITLTVTPLRSLLNQPQLTRFRRMFGLYAFFYGSVHLMIWMGLDKQFNPEELWKDILKRWYITVGMAGWLGMVPLTVTSTAGWVRRMGYRKWQKLHRIVYASAALGVTHYYLLVKSDIRLPLMYGAILAILLLYRVGAWMRKKRLATRPAPIPVAK